MKYWNRYTSNYILLIFFIASAIWLWGLGKSSFGIFWYTPWLYLAQASGIISLTALSLTFIFSTRLTILWVIFGELQHIYKIHKISGIIGYTFLILHILFLFIRSIKYPALLNLYWMPGTNWAIDFGTISFIILSVVVISTYINKIPYHIWKKIHYLSGPAYLFAIFHTLMVTSDIKFNQPLRVWSIGLMICAGASYIYIRFLYRYIGPKSKYVVTQVKKVAKSMYEISMDPLKEKIDYNPGQFAFFSFESKELGTEVHPYTIITTSDNKTLKIFCKQLGDFSNKIPELKVGTPVTIWGPYGVFWDEYQIDRSEQVWIARGVGITPFLSMLQHERERPLKAKKWLFYSTRNEEEDVPDEYIIKNIEYTNVSLIKHHTDELGYLTIDHVLQHIPELKGKVFFICGPNSMIDHFKSELVQRGVDPNNVVYEDFNIR